MPAIDGLMKFQTFMQVNFAVEGLTLRDRHARRGAAGCRWARAAPISALDSAQHVVFEDRFPPLRSRRSFTWLSHGRSTALTLRPWSRVSSGSEMQSGRLARIACTIPFATSQPPIAAIVSANSSAVG